MALHGLTISTWLGWVFGIIILRTPWGPPRLSSWLTFSVFYSLLLLFFYIFIVSDTVINTPRSLALTETNLLAMWITRLEMVTFLITFLIFRIFMIVSAKKMAKFMSQLHFYPLPKPSQKWINSMLLQSLIVSAVYLTYFTATFLGLFNYLTTASHQVPHSLLGRTLGKTAYWIVLTIFFLLQQGTLNNVTYAILLHSALRLARIFQSFADDTVEMLEELRQSWEESRHIQAQAGKGERLMEEDLKVKCIRHQILVRFKEIKNIFETGDSLMSPLLLNTIVTGTLAFIVSVSKALVVARSAMSGIVDVFKALNCCLFIVVYEIGERANKTIADSKLKIYQKYITISWESPHKAELEGVIDHIQIWQWKLSAGGFFSIDRKLLKGILNVIMTYVIIFFQMYVQLNITPPTPIPCSSDGNNATLA